LVLLGAVLAASLPELGRQTWRKPAGAGWSFRLALEVLGALNTAKLSKRRGLSNEELVTRLRVESTELGQVLQVLQSLDWVGGLTEQNDVDQARLVLLIDPSQVCVGPLADRLLVSRIGEGDPVWLESGLDRIQLAQLLPQANS
jgi:membrane protein